MRSRVTRRGLWALLAVSLRPRGGEMQSRLPIIDMHLHARRADYAGRSPPPMCTPFARLPRWDPAPPIATGLIRRRAACANPVPAATTDDSGGPGEFYFGSRGYRARNNSALTLEEVLRSPPAERPVGDWWKRAADFELTDQKGRIYDPSN